MPYTRTELEALKRTELQQICKDYGVKANLKSDALIDLILDASEPPRTRSTSTRQSSRVSSRNVSTSVRRASARISSVIIHGDTIQAQDVDTTQSSQSTSLVRTRKAKETQRRLGVGKPKAAGGNGARSVTRAISPSKGRRGRSSRSVIPTIAEESKFYYL
jgi:hypothetical protein